MSMAPPIELIIIFALILFNGVLSMSEIAIVSSRKARLHQLADQGDKNAKAALDISNSPNEFLSTVQIGITLVGIFTGAYGEANIADDLTFYLKQVPMLAPHAAQLALFLVVAIITYFSLILGELVPKRLGLHFPEKIARFVALPMQVLSNLSRPLVIVLSSSTNFVLRVFGIKESSEPPVTEAEIQVLVEQATEAGVFEESEQEMLASVLRLGDRSVKSIMIPRADVDWVDINISPEELVKVLEESSHSRLVVTEESPDHVLGIVELKGIMRNKISGKPVDLRAITTQPAYVPESFTVLDLLETFRGTKQHVAIVMDEYGGMEGLVTREDVFEAIVGELPAVGELPKWEARQREDGSWLLDGQIPLDDFKKIFDVDKLPGEEEAGYHTLAGFVLFHLERIPAAGEYFVWEDLRFEVVDMDHHRIDKLLVSRIAPDSDTKSGD